MELTKKLKKISLILYISRKIRNGLNAVPKKLKNFMDAIFLLIRCPQMNWKKWSNFSIQKT